MPAGGKIVVASSTPATLVSPVVIPEVKTYPRYSYLSPGKPVHGNSSQAQLYFASAVRSHKSGNYSQALAEYQRATQLDPAYYEAWYNEGLAAYASENYKQSLAAYEYALVLKPESMDARYNFALALKQAGYPLDAADQLAKLLDTHPDESRAHYSLGNLYAEQLSDPQTAREHYLKLLQVDPNHPKAGEIRYWLAANPPKS
jgi:tetratricopeptide (TPR) repeat protein